MSTAALDLQTLVIQGQSAAKHHADLLQAVESLTMRETITGASTIDVTLKDPHRTLLRSGLLSGRSTIVLDDAGFELAAVKKAGTSLSVTFEDMAVAALRQRKGSRAVAAGTMSRAQFCVSLIREVPWIHVAAAPGAKSLVQLARGTGSTTTPADTGIVGGWGTYGAATPGSPLDPLAALAAAAITQVATSHATTKTAKKADEEDSWTAITRIMADIGWRACVVRGVVYLAPDSYLMSHALHRYALSETADGVDNIDLDYDIGKPAATATATVWAGRTALSAGSAVTLTGMGAGDGTWLVETITRTAHSKQATASLIRPQPTLPEPQDTAGLAALGGNLGQGGWGSLPTFTTTPVTGSFSENSGQGQGIAERFVQAALLAQGHAYVYGASGPTSWDCSGLVQWAARRVGVTISKPVQAQYARIRAAGGIISVEQAIGTRGAVLIRLGSPYDHIAVSLGNGQTMEAKGKAYGCGIFPAPNRGWTCGGIIPGIPVTPRSTKDLRGG